VLRAASAAWFSCAPRAEAHALVISTDPSAGSNLTQLPKAVTATFSERILPSLSKLWVADASGRAVSRGPSRLVPGNALQLTVPLPALLGPRRARTISGSTSWPRPRSASA
jgi:methionine-rich copper-binding protein CopC